MANFVEINGFAINRDLVAWFASGGPVAAEEHDQPGYEELNIFFLGDDDPMSLCMYSDQEFQAAWELLANGVEVADANGSK